MKNNENYVVRIINKSLADRYSKTCTEDYFCVFKLPANMVVTEGMEYVGVLRDDVEAEDMFNEDKI